MPSKRRKGATSAKLAAFIQQYQRKAQKGGEPNDRGYDRGLEEKLKRLKPEQLSELLSGETDEGVPVLKRKGKGEEA